MQSTSSKAVPARGKRVRQPYAPPKLIEYGAVAELTASGSGSNQEQVFGGSDLFCLRRDHQTPCRF